MNLIAHRKYDSCSVLLSIWNVGCGNEKGEENGRGKKRVK